MRYGNDNYVIYRRAHEKSLNKRAEKCFSR